MKIPLQITFQDIPPSEAVEAKIREAAAKLEKFYTDIMSCRAVVSSPAEAAAKGETLSCTARRQRSGKGTGRQP